MARKRLAWLATYVFMAKNDAALEPDGDAAYDFVIAVAAGESDDVGEITKTLSSWPATSRSLTEDLERILDALSDL